MRMHFATAVAAISLVGLSGGSALAQEVMDLEAWDAAELQGSWRATEMTDAAVYGANGEDIGEVSSVIVGPDNRVKSIVVEAGGFFDIGDTHFSVPWDQVDITPGQEGIRVPVNEDNVDDFDLFGDEVTEGRRAWRASELVGDRAVFANGDRYGIVSDLLFGPDGSLTSVVVNPSVGYGVGGFYAYPWRGYEYGYDPGSPYYDLGYSEDEIAGLDPIDFDEIDGDLI